MINKIICVLLLILFFILLYLVYQEVKKNKSKNNIESFKLLYNNDKKIEHFESDDKPNLWSDDKNTIDEKTKGLNSNQKKEVTNLINVKVNDEVKKTLNNQSSVNYGSVGKQGEQGPSGPAGGEYIASGLLVNKKHSYDENDKLNMSVTRVYGEGDTGKAYLEIADKFSPSTYWYLYKDGSLRNRLDDMCLTTSGKNSSDLYMNTCTNDSNQNWKWDNKSNRIILSESKGAGGTSQKCITLSNPKIDENTLLAGCADNKCGSKQKRFLKLGECKAGVQDDEVWSFH